jgi:transposase
VAGLEDFSREELIALVSAQAKLIEELRAEVAELKRQAGRNSQNSSTPPSADGLAKPPPRSMRTRSGRKPGKQDGAAGFHLAQVAGPDERVRHFPVRCGACDRRLRRADRAGEPVRRQVFDVPEMTVTVTEHELHAAACRGCGTVTRAQGPAWASAPAAYGPNVTALAAYLSAQHHIPVGRVAEILADACGIEVSAGWVTEACRRVEAAVAPANAAIRDAIAAAVVVHFGESVTRVAGRNHWMHTAATARLTAYHIDEHGRGVEAIKAFGILPRFTGVAVHDAYKGYDGFAGCAHALCNAHAVRELAGIGEFDPAARADGWAGQMINLLGDAYRWAGAWNRKGHTRLPDFKADDLRRRWDELIGQALAAHPPRTGKQTPARNLALRLRDRREEFLHFTTDFTVAFSNDLASHCTSWGRCAVFVWGGRLGWLADVILAWGGDIFAGSRAAGDAVRVAAA